MPLLYVETPLLDHPRTQQIQQRVGSASIPITRYGEIFNRQGSHFRLQKNNPAFILAEKHGNLIYKIPESYGIGAPNNYYFSHILNCPYDCNYCFLQGMYRSAHYVIFINYESFATAIEEKIGTEKTTFFSGYDGDSLALDSLTGFLDYFLPFFAQHPTAELELRTKSVSIQKLLSIPSFPNCVIAFTLSPDSIINAHEKKTPSLARRLKAIAQLQAHGWNIGLRFDPLIYCNHFKDVYSAFFNQVLSSVKNPHSITLGTFRLPTSTFKQMQRIKPQEKLLACCTEKNGMMTFPQAQEMLDFCLSLLPKEKVFICQ